MYFADPSSPLSAPHLARIRAEVRINMAMGQAWFGEACRFDGIDIVPSLAAIKCPSLVIAGDNTTSSTVRRGTGRSRQRFRLRVSWRSLTQVTSRSTSNLVLSEPHFLTG